MNAPPSILRTNSGKLLARPFAYPSRDAETYGQTVYPFGRDAAERYAQPRGRALGLCAAGLYRYSVDKEARITVTYPTDTIKTRQAAYSYAIKQGGETLLSGKNSYGNEATEEFVNQSPCGVLQETGDVSRYCLDRSGNVLTASIFLELRHATASLADITLEGMILVKGVSPAKVDDEWRGANVEFHIGGYYPSSAARIANSPGYRLISRSVTHTDLSGQSDVAWDLDKDGTTFSFTTSPTMSQSPRIRFSFTYRYVDPTA